MHELNTDFVNTVLKNFDEKKEIFKERNATYKQNFVDVANILGVLYPNGVTSEVISSPLFSLLVLKLVKLTRFVASDLKHLDSIDDDAVYSVLMSSYLKSTTKTKSLDESDIKVIMTKFTKIN